MIKPLLQQETQLLEDNSRLSGASAPWGDSLTEPLPTAPQPGFLYSPNTYSFYWKGKKKKRKVLKSNRSWSKRAGMAHSVSPALCWLLGPHALGRSRSSCGGPHSWSDCNQSVSVTLVSLSLASFRSFWDWHGLTQFLRFIPSFLLLRMTQNGSICGQDYSILIEPCTYWGSNNPLSKSWKLGQNSIY